MSVTVVISSDKKKKSSDEDKDVRRGTVNSNTNDIVHESPESSYESPSKDFDLSHEPWRHHFNTTSATFAGKVSSKVNLCLRLAFGTSYRDFQTSFRDFHTAAQCLDMKIS